MTHEEKLQEAKRLYKSANSDQRYVLESLFPELRESGGERIRKRIIALINAHGQSMYKDEMLAWLEKQKTSEEALQYLKENHSPSEVSDFQAAMNIAVAKAYDKGIKDGLEKQGKKPVEEYNITGITSGHATGKLAEIIKDIESEDKIEALRTEYAKGRADAIAEKQVVWSDEDKVMLDEIIDFFENGTVKLQHDLSLYASWLKSLKDRVQPKQEWSEET